MVVNLVQRVEMMINKLTKQHLVLVYPYCKLPNLVRMSFVRARNIEAVINGGRSSGESDVEVLIGES